MSAAFQKPNLLSLAFIGLVLVPTAMSQTVVNVLPATDGAWGLDYHDDHLWLGDDRDGFLRKIDPADGAILAVLPTPYDENHISYGANHGVAWDGSGFWVAGDYGKDWLYKVAIDGAFLDTLATPADAIGGLSFDGTYLLVTRYYPNDQADILRVDPATGAIVGAPIPTQGQQPFGIAYDTSDDTIWNGMDDNDGDPEKVWHLTYPDGSVIDSFDAPAGSPKGIALGGGYMWVVASEIGGNGRKIYQIDLSGAGTGDIEALPASHDFGITSLGTPAARLQVLRNVGDGPLTIFEITTGGVFSADEVTLPVELAPLESIDFNVTFDPPVAGNYAGLLTVRSDDFDEEILEIPLAGTAAVPDPTINAAPPLLDFADTGRGLVRGRDLVLQNLGYQALVITNVTSSSAFFEVPTIALPITLQTFETFAMTIVFAPDAPASYSAALTITSNDPGTPTLPINLSGDGVLKSWAPGEVIWWAAGIENVVSVLPLPDLQADGRPEVVMETYDAGADGDPHVALRGNSDGGGVKIWATGAGTSGGWGDLCLSLIDDLDDDGFPEILRGTAWGGRSVEVRGSEDGALLWAFDTYVHDGGGWVYSVAPMPDLSGDGKPEVLAAAGTNGGPGTGSRRIYCLDGASGAVRFTYMATDAFNCVIAIPDVNGDEIPDIVGGNANESVYCVSGASVGGGSLLWTYDTGGNAAFVDVIADVSGDGIADVIAGSWSSQVFCINGSTGLQFWSQPVGNYVLQSRVIDDVTGDGVSDIAVCNFGNNFRVLNGADGTLHWITPTGGNVWSIYPIPDVDGDGVTDVLAGAQDDLVYCVSGASDDTTGDIIWTTNLGDLVFSVRSIKDVNGNGTPDVVAGTQYLNGSGGNIFCLDGGRGAAGVNQDPLADGPPLRLLGAYPNPTTQSCTILFHATPEFDEQLVLDIYDLTGRRIQSLEAKAASGLGHLTWDGREQDGREAASGLYFYSFRNQTVEGNRGRIMLNR